jgi:probable HAF family extracellular repeat protein
MNRTLPALRRRSIFTVVLLTSALLFHGAVLRPTTVAAQSPPNCYTTTELTLGNLGAQAIYFTRSGYVLGVGPDSSYDYHTFVYNATGIHDLDAAVGSPNSYFNIGDPQKALSEDGSAFGVAIDNSSSQQQAVIYDSTGLHQLSLGGTFGVAIDINDAGQATGAATDVTEATFHAFRYDHGTMVDLGTLGGSRSYPYAISENGQVVGEATNANEDSHAFLYDGTSMIDLGVLSGGTRSLAVAVNDAGQAAGYSEVTGGAQHAFIYDGTTMQDLGVLSGGSYSNATYINSSGHVAGIADDSIAQQHVFLYDGTTMQDLTPGASYAEILRFTDSDVVVGRAYTSSSAYIFVYDSTGLHNISLGGANSDAYGSFGGTGSTNSSGSVAGLADTTGGAALHAFLYDSTNGVQDLNASPGDDGSALGISESGEVVGYSNGSAFLYSGGVMTDLNTLLCSTGITLQAAYGIGDDGTILAADTDQGHLYLLTPPN